MESLQTNQTASQESQSCVQDHDHGEECKQQQHDHSHSDHHHSHDHSQAKEKTAPIIKCQYNIEFQHFHQSGWDFHHSEYPMFSAKQLDQVSDVVGTMSMPEVFYGFNRLFVSNPDHDILLEFAPVEALSLASFVKREALIKKQKTGTDEIQNLEQMMETLNLNFKSGEIELNLIDMIPKNIEVKEAEIWKAKDMSKVKDFKQIEIISDWTYSTPYKGNVRYMSNHAERLKKETSLELKSISKGEIKIEPTEESLPLDKLGRDNPILHFGEVFLYEDDLGDQGYTRMQIRFRAMKDCFYILLRYYLRVDKVLVRILDTRIYHDFSQDFIHREFMHKESTYEQLRTKEFNLGSDWSLSKTQSDEIFPHLEQKFKTLDKVFFK